MRISFVVPTYRRPEALRATLEALRALDHPETDYEVVVVDDGSGDATETVVGAYVDSLPRMLYVQQANSGVARARNAGAAAASGRLLIFLDDDILVEPDHIERHLAVHESYERCLVNGHWEFSPATRATLEASPFGRFRIRLEDWVKTATEKDALADGRLRPSQVTAANLSIRREDFESMGGFDQAFPFAGCEDQDFSHRAADAGYQFVYDPEIKLLHNDERVTLGQFCARQRRGAHTSVYLAARHPDTHVERALLLENAFPTAFDPWQLRLKKLAKRIYSSRAGLGCAAAAARVLERRAPRSRALERVYSMTIGAYIFLGVRDGLAELPAVQSAAVEAMRRRQQRA